MKKKRHKPEEIVAKLRQVDVLTSQGTPMADAIRTSHKAHRRARHRSSAQIEVASSYWRPQLVSSGGRFDPSAMTAAHGASPFGTRVRVTHAGNGRSVDAKIK